LIESLPIKENGVHMNLVSFGRDPVAEDISPSAASGFTFSTSEAMWNHAESYDKQTIRATADNFFETKASRYRQFTDFRPIFDDYGAIRLAGQERPLLIIASDGKPLLKGREFRRNRLRASLKASCDANARMREANPDIKVLCFQSTQKSRSSKFFKCACDATWVSKPLFQTAPSHELITKQMLSFICTDLVEEKKADPCFPINAQYSNLRKRKFHCIRVKRDINGNPVDPDDIFQDRKTIRRQCFFNGRSRQCEVFDIFKELYLPPISS
jgi:hypothetical protein